MPYAEEFRSAADVFDAEASTVVDTATALTSWMGPEVLQGGQLTRDVEALLDESISGAEIDADSLRELAEECRWRASECDAAAADHQQWVAAVAAHDRALSEWRVTTERARQDTAAPMISSVPPAAPTRPVLRYDWIEF